MKQNGLSRRNWEHRRNWNGSERDSFNYKYHKWDYISSPHLLLGGESGSENQEFFAFDWFINS